MEWVFGGAVLILLVVIYGSLSASEGRLEDISILLRHQNADRIDSLHSLDIHLKKIASDLDYLQSVAREYELASPNPTAEQYGRALAVVANWHARDEAD